MIEITTNEEAIKQLAKALENNTKLLKRDINTALNATARHLKSQWAIEISNETTLTQKIIKETIKQELARAGGEAKAAVSQKKSSRVSLKEYKATQTKKGVSYRINKGAKGSKKLLLANSFIWAKNGHVFTRGGAKRVMKKGRYVGKMRQPIVKRFGPSPFETTQKREIPVKLIHLGIARLLEELKKRIRFRTLRASGAI